MKQLACWSAEDVAKKAPSAAKQVKSERLCLGTVVVLGIVNRVWITYVNHFAELLTMETFKACVARNRLGPKSRNCIAGSARRSSCRGEGA
ncbi:unnamed protein product [Peronospora belbahrii]|uniref:Uncharacterized protein n=1 Tax=Peronospora belbahrii TaxID=622444 RepID=A0AAU9L7D0_9STRA|nr:unnamed protein product [Peronospora belbahrii]